ncbi:MAG: RsmD family RNA methyltransferase [Acidobacteria bacterium]|nr:RsmD family RNA methyltransferase [Acidobacteriota bacterium]
MNSEEPGPPTELRIGQTVDATIEKSVYRGRGLARVGGRVVFVPRAHTGDRVRGRVREVHAGWAEASLQDVLSPAPERRPSPCPYVPRCGGCVYQDLDYAAQLRAKEDILRESLARAGAPWEGPIAVRASPERGWRLRASLHFARGDAGLRLGLRPEGTRRVLDIEACLQLSDNMNRTVRKIHAALARRPKTWPRLRGLDVLESPDGELSVATLATALAPHEAPDLAFVGREAAGLSGLGVETGRGRLHWLAGSPHIEATVLSLALRVHVQSFFQANRFLYEPLAQAVLELLPGAGRALDLYAGVGLFTLPLAARDDCEVVAVERAPSAADDARANARRHRLSGIRVVRRDVGDALAATRAEPGERVVIDPPRTGLERDVVELVASRRPEAVVYVSCDPPTLGRDLARFAAHGLRADSVQVFDLFPDTFHLETVVRLLPS